MGPPLENGHASDSTSTYQPVNNNVEDEALSQTKIKQLESELPPSLTETVPLGLLVDRVAVEVYRDLHTLAETCVFMLLATGKRRELSRGVLNRTDCPH